MLKAVIFDLDGTLTNCDLELAKKTVSEELAALTGTGYEDVRKKMDTIHYQCNITSIYDRNVWWEHFDSGLPPYEKQRLTDLYWNCVVETTYVKAHAELLLKRLKEKGIILVLLTDYDGKSFSKRKRVDLLPLVSYFDLVVIAGDDTEETKPALEPFTFILDRLTVNPDEVLMVGDKPEVDLESAHTLGMKTLLVEGDYGDQWEHTVKDLLHVLDYIESL
jgi:FMN phosphatase YigB (HAD superfamily)